MWLQIRNPFLGYINLDGFKTQLDNTKYHTQSMLQHSILNRGRMHAPY